MIKLMTTHKVLYSKDNIYKLSVSRKEVENGQITFRIT